jgi:hypothetical protein
VWRISYYSGKSYVPGSHVELKFDLGIVDGARERLVSILESEKRSVVASDAHNEQRIIELSIKEGRGVEELRQEVMWMLGEVRVVLDAMSVLDERSVHVA